MAFTKILGPGIATDTNVQVGILTATKFYGDGSELDGITSAGLGTALSQSQTSPLNKVYYTDQVLSIGQTVTVNPPASAVVAYTQYAEILVEEDADFIVDDGDDFIADVLGLSTEGVRPIPGAGGRVRADNFTNKAGTGAPTFPNGVTVLGTLTGTATTATTAGYATTANAASYATISGIATNAQGLIGSPSITVTNVSAQDVQVGGALTVTGNLTVNGTQTIINTTNLEIKDPLVGIGSGNTTDAQADGAGIIVYGNTNKSLLYDNTRKGWDFNIPLTTDEVRFYNVAEKLTRSSGNTVSLSYSSSGSNIGFATNPTGDITLAVTGIPTTSDFDNHVITFSVFVSQTGTARSCTAVRLNGFNATIRWSGGSLLNSISGVTTTSGMDIYSFTGINTVGSASTTANYYVLGIVNGGYR